jgi:hypothetical protein
MHSKPCNKGSIYLKGWNKFILFLDNTQVLQAVMERCLTKQKENFIFTCFCVDENLSSVFRTYQRNFRDIDMWRIASSTLHYPSVQTAVLTFTEHKEEQRKVGSGEKQCAVDCVQCRATDRRAFLRWKTIIQLIAFKLQRLCNIVAKKELYFTLSTFILDCETVYLKDSQDVLYIYVWGIGSFNCVKLCVFSSVQVYITM